MNDQTELSCELPFAGEYVLMINGQRVTTFIGAEGERITVRFVPPKPAAGYSLATVPAFGKPLVEYIPRSGNRVD